MISVDHLKGITVFVHAADAEGFAEAGRQLGLSKSGVAKTIMRLEDRLGIRLFERMTRRFALTPDGQAFYETCARVLSELEGVETALTTDDPRPRGRLRVALPTVFGRRWVVPVLLEIAGKYPDLSIDVFFTDRDLDLVEEGIDLLLHIGESEDDDRLVTQKLGVQQSVLCASPEYIERMGEPATVKDLDVHPCIVLTRSGQPLPWWFVDETGTPLAYRASGRLTFNDAEAVCDAALQGHGIARLSTWLLVDHLRSGRLRTLLPNVPTLGFPIHAVWPRARHVVPRVRVVIDELTKRFLPLAPWES